MHCPIVLSFGLTKRHTIDVLCCLLSIFQRMPQPIKTWFGEFHRFYDEISRSKLVYMMHTSISRNVQPSSKMLLLRLQCQYVLLASHQVHQGQETHTHGIISFQLHSIKADSKGSCHTQCATFCNISAEVCKSIYIYIYIYIHFAAYCVAFFGSSRAAVISPTRWP